MLDGQWFSVCLCPNLGLSDIFSVAGPAAERDVFIFLSHNFIIFAKFSCFYFFRYEIHLKFRYDSFFV